MPDKDLILNEFNKGIGLSPSTGFEEIRYLDVYSNLGTVQLNFNPTATTGDTPTGLVKAFLRTTSTVIGNWAIDDAGKLYIGDDTSFNYLSAASSPGAFMDFVVWENYIVCFSSSDIRLYKLSGTPGWYTTGSAWQSLTPSSAPFRTCLVSQTGDIFFANDRYIGSISKNGTFDPANPATYNMNMQALDLPPGYRIKTITEFGSYLAIGTYKGQADVAEERVADIFFWDTFSSSFQNNVIRLNEFGIHQMTVENNLLYIVAGREGTVYVSNGTSVEKLRSLPRHVTGVTNNKYLDFLPKAITSHKGRIYFGVSSGTSSATLNGIGVWSVDRRGVLIFEDKMTSGFTDGNATKIGALFATGTDRYLFSWKDSVNKGVNYISDTNHYTSYSGYFISPLFEVGTPHIKKTFRELDIVLEKPLAANEAVRVSYRPDRTAAFNTPKVFDYATYSNKQFAGITFPAADLVTFQVKVELTGTTTTPVIKELRFR
jgi:hypothetical protein